MPTSLTPPFLRQLRRAVSPQGPGTADADLLCRYVAARDEEAFEAIVRRHGPMVFGVCSRLLRDPHDALDAFQATFLVLVRKAATVSPPGMLPNWLHGVARQTAVRARAAAARRGRRERAVADLPEAVARPDGHAHDLRPLLDEELARLPAKNRAAVVTCDLEGLSHREAAARLGWPVGTLASRLSRGRAMLAKRLSRRGGAALASQGVLPVTVPASLVSSAVRAGSLYGSGQAAAAGAIAPQVAALTEGVLRAMSYGKAKTLAAVLLLVGLAPIGAGHLARYAAADGPSEGVSPKPTPLTLRQPASDDAVTPPKGGWSQGSVTLGRGPQDYKRFFIKTLGVVSEYFESVSYANQYDGRIEASSAADKGSPPVTRQAFVNIQAGDDGSFSITVRVNEVTGAGTKREVVGRDAELERVVLRRLKGQQPPPGTKRVTEGKELLEVGSDGKRVQVRAAFGGERLEGTADRMSYDGEGKVLVLVGNATLRIQKGKERPSVIEAQRIVLNRRTGKVSVDGGGRLIEEPKAGVRVILPPLGQTPIGLDFGFPVTQGQDFFNFALGLTR